MMVNINLLGERSQYMLRTFVLTIFGLVLIGCANYGMAPTETIQITSTIVDTTELGPNATPTKTSTDSTGATMSNLPKEITTQNPGIEVFSFRENEPAWYTVDDNVMGGVSRSSVEISDSNTLFFSGTMSLDNNGGFSSVRSDWTTTNLKGADGVMLRVLGDGKMYRLRIRSAETGSEISYNAAFETTPETWKVVYIPFDRMVPTYRGILMNVEALDPASIRSFGFMLSDKQPGDFALQVDWIRAVTEEEFESYQVN
jgi:monofunctional biosynthetic peptidoglycan transglycosylase